MKKLFALLSLFIFLTMAVFAQEKTQYVKGYTKKNGTHVNAYKRAPRGSKKH